jgi:glutamate/tyrosine decarboxylase-like PLP-dependent enzyme
VLAAHGWDVEARGLQGAPRVTSVVGAEGHATIGVALRALGLGAPTIVVDADDQGRMRPDALAAALGGLAVGPDTAGAAGTPGTAAAAGTPGTPGAARPVIVCAQAGNVNTGAFDPFPAIVEMAHRHGAWVHVDGAFGLWAAASPRRRPLTAGVAGADSWSVDGHKWLNVPYDSAYAVTAHPAAHRAAHASTAGYYVPGAGDRDGMDWAPEASRRARGIATWAALRSLGRDGVADLVERCCAHARRLAERVAGEPGVAVLGDVVLNQVLLRFGDDDERTRAVIAELQRDGTCWAGGSVWRGRAVMRWSVSNWRTTAADIDRSADALIAAHRRTAG